MKFSKKINALGLILVFFGSSILPVHAQLGGIFSEIKNLSEEIKKNTSQQQSNEEPKSKTNSVINSQVENAQGGSNTKKNQIATTVENQIKINKGFYVKGDLISLKVVESDSMLDFILSINHQKNSSICVEGDVTCLSIEGKALHGNDGKYVYSDKSEDCNFKLQESQGGVIINDVNGSCGTGSANRAVLTMIPGQYTLKTSSTPQPKVVDGSPVPQKSAVAGGALNASSIGYLNKGFDDGAGCVYFKRKEERKKYPEPIAAYDYGTNKVVININGKDVLLEANSKTSGLTASNSEFSLLIKNGKAASCGEECSKEYTNIELKSQGGAVVMPVYSICGS